MSVPYLTTKKLLTIKKLKNVVDLLATGCTVRSACAASDISHVAFYAAVREDTEYAETVEAAQQCSIKTVENALFKNATEMLNLGAQVFWLCNRAPDRWKNIQRIEQSIEVRADATINIRDEIAQLQKEEDRLNRLIAETRGAN